MSYCCMKYFIVGESVHEVIVIVLIIIKSSRTAKRKKGRKGAKQVNLYCSSTFVTAITEAKMVMKPDMKATTGFHTNGMHNASRTA